MRKWTVVFVLSAACNLEGGPCGDGVVDQSLGEQCEICPDGSIFWGSCDDPGGYRGDPDACDATCQLPPPVCGNGMVEGDESCEPCEDGSYADPFYYLCPGFQEAAPGYACIDCQWVETPIAGPEIEIEVSGECASSITITSDPPGIDCGETCSASFASETNVRMNAATPAGTRVTWGGDCIGVDGPTSPAATIVSSGEAQTCTAFCEGMEETGFYIALPFVPTIRSTGTILRLVPEGFDDTGRHPVTELYPNIASCEWRVDREGETLAMPVTGPECLLELGNFTEIPLRRGLHHVYAVVVLDTGERSIEASTAFTVDVGD
jgi:hypothetical protein